MPRSVQDERLDGKTLMNKETKDPSFDEMIQRCPRLDEAQRRKLIRGLRLDRLEWTPSQ
jgi:hypothetical protein